MSDRQREQRRPPKGLRYVVYAGLGMVVLLMLTLSAAVFLGGSGPAAPDIPPTEFAYDYHDNGTLRVTYVNGSTLDDSNTDKIEVLVRDTVRRTFALPIETGDALTIEGVPNGSRIEVVWFGPDGSEVPVDRRTITADGNATAN